MAVAELNPMLEGIHGKFGDLTFRRTLAGKTSLIKRADMSNVVWSEAQQEQRQRFRAANVYARACMEDEQARRHYETLARESHRRAYHLAVADYFKGVNLLGEGHYHEEKILR